VARLIFFLLPKDLSSSVEHEQQDSMDGLCKQGIRSAWFWDWWKNKKKYSPGVIASDFDDDFDPY
tara:strand:- start:6 stop:200 length:195 start_codon:yes stop_codon:yes gene_type:complete